MPQVNVISDVIKAYKDLKQISVVGEILRGY